MDIINDISNFFDLLYKKNYLLYIILFLGFLSLVALLKGCSQDSVGVIFNDTEQNKNYITQNQSFNNYTIQNQSFNNNHTINISNNSQQKGFPIG